MLDIHVTIEGDKAVIKGLEHLSANLAPACRKALIRSAVGVFNASFKLLSGPGAMGKTSGTAFRDSLTGKWKIRQQKWTRQDIPAGGYPVPVRKRKLSSSLDWLKPEESKTHPAGTFTAGENEVVIYNAAVYANVIHEGKHTSAKHGPRRYLTDALEKFNQGDRIKRLIEEEIRQVIEKGSR
jgi:hypothetical protein